VIIETIVTTLDTDGAVNIAPMGVEWTGADDAPILKPFLETVTYRNVVATRAAVVNLVDDVRVFARAAISNPSYAVLPATVVRGAVLEIACSWRELQIRSIDSTPPRSRIETEIVHRGFRREFIGTAHDTPCSRRRSTPHACTCSRATSSSRSSPGCR
jgi:uncharacterized protein